MATTYTRYVDADSPAGGTGEDPQLSGATRAYSSLNACEAARQAAHTGGDITAATGDDSIEQWVCMSIDGAHSVDTAALTINGWTTAAANYIETIAAEASRASAVWDTTKYRLAQSMSLAELYHRCRYLQLAGGVEWDLDLASAPGEHTVEGCAIKGAAFGLAPFEKKNQVFNLFNNVIWNCTTGISCNAAAATGVVWNIYNNTLVDNTTHFSFDARSGGVARVRNNLCAFGTTWTQVGTFTSSTITHNAYGQGSDPGTSGVDISGQTGAQLFADYAGDDFHLRLPSAVRRLGVNLAGTFTTDIDRHTRPALWDIGADQLTPRGPFVSARPELL